MYINLNYLPGHSIGRSDGRCVQRAGTQSVRDNYSHILGIHRWQLIISITGPHHDGRSFGCVIYPRKRRLLAEYISIARVRPGTAKGITDLSLTNTSLRYPNNVPLRNYLHNLSRLILVSVPRYTSTATLSEYVHMPKPS